MSDSPIVPAVSVAVLRGNTVLLVKRGRKPSAGFYAFPGGRVEPGETDDEAALRELREETGVDVTNLRPLRVVNIPPSIEDEAPGYRLIVYAADWFSGEPVAADDAAEAAFFGREQLATLPTTDSTDEIALQLLDGKI